MKFKLNKLNKLKVPPKDTVNHIMEQLLNGLKDLIEKMESEAQKGEAGNCEAKNNESEVQKGECARKKDDTIGSKDILGKAYDNQLEWNTRMVANNNIRNFTVRLVARRCRNSIYEYYLVEIGPLYSKQGCQELDNVLRLIKGGFSSQVDVTRMKYRHICYEDGSWIYRPKSKLKPYFVSDQRYIDECIDYLKEENTKNLEEQVNEHNNARGNTVQYIVNIDQKEYILEMPIEPNKYLIRRLRGGHHKYFIIFNQLNGAKILNYKGEQYYDAYLLNNVKYKFLESNQKVIDDINDDINRRYGFV